MKFLHLWHFFAVTPFSIYDVSRYSCVSFDSVSLVGVHFSLSIISCNHIFDSFLSIFVGQEMAVYLCARVDYLPKIETIWFMTTFLLNVRILFSFFFILAKICTLQTIWLFHKGGWAFLVHDFPISWFYWEASTVATKSMNALENSEKHANGLLFIVKHRAQCGKFLQPISTFF